MAFLNPEPTLKQPRENTKPAPAKYFYASSKQSMTVYSTVDYIHKVK